jgi:hypothetical protein
MKAKYFISTLVLLSINVFAQKEMKEVKVPKSVSTAFTKLYPKATEVKWEKEGDEEFEANFKNNSVEISVVIDDNGKLMETETVVQVSDLPASVAPYIAKKYAGYTLSRAAKIVDAKGNITFEAEITKGEVKKELMFGKNGKLVVKKEKKNEKEENDEKEEHGKD